MLSIPTLTKGQVNHFRRNGFVALPKAFNELEAAIIQEWSLKISQLPEECGKHWVYHEPSLLSDDKKIINRIENMTPFHKGFRELAESLKSSVEQLFGEQAVLFKEKINFKMPGGSGFKPHQDAQAGWEDYASYFVNVMVCVDAATIQNGCLQLAQRLNATLIGNEWEPLTEAETEHIEFEPYPTEPGDIIYFDSYVPHASEPNMTSRSRRLYFATYNRLSEGDHLASYYADKRKSFPPDIEREHGKTYIYRV